jgi:hypothetical protein
MDPKKTIRLLDVLQGLGFSDEAFRLIHHFRLVGRNATINRHRRYCEGLETFADGGTNELVQRRLKLVLQGTRQEGSRPAKRKFLWPLPMRPFRRSSPFNSTRYIH